MCEVVIQEQAVGDSQQEAADLSRLHRRSVNGECAIIEKKRKQDEAIRLRES